MVKEEGSCGYGIFAALAQTVETEWSSFLLTWLGWRDSNPLYRSQSPVCYHYTTSQDCRTSAKTGRHGRPVVCKWGGIWGSNPRHPEPQSGALPTELIPPYQFLRREGGQTAAPNPLPPPGAGTPRGTRTPDLLLRRQLLYPAELLAHMRCTRPEDGAGDGNRTHVSSLEGWCSTIELHPHGRFLIQPRDNTISNGSVSTIFSEKCKKAASGRCIILPDAPFWPVQRLRRSSSRSATAKYSLPLRLISST